MSHVNWAVRALFQRLKPFGSCLLGALWCLTCKQHDTPDINPVSNSSMLRDRTLAMMHIRPTNLCCLSRISGLPLTDPQLSGAYAVLSAHDPDAVQWEVFKNVPTLVILMGGRALPRIVEKLRQTFYSAGTMPVSTSQRRAGLIGHIATCQPAHIDPMCVRD